MRQTYPPPDQVGGAVPCRLLLSCQESVKCQNGRRLRRAT
jgi:hypothetical protein